MRAAALDLLFLTACGAFCDGTDMTQVHRAWDECPRVVAGDPVQGLTPRFGMAPRISKVFDWLPDGGVSDASIVCASDREREWWSFRADACPNDCDREGSEHWSACTYTDCTVQVDVNADVACGSSRFGNRDFWE